MYMMANSNTNMYVIVNSNTFSGIHYFGEYNIKFNLHITQNFCIETHGFYRRREDRYSKSTAYYIKREKTLVSLTEKLMGKIGL